MAGKSALAKFPTVEILPGGWVKLTVHNGQAALTTAEADRIASKLRQAVSDIQKAKAGKAAKK